MPRANRYLQAGHAYHLTHRCHDRRFLLKFVRDRDCYRKWLYEAVKRYGVAVYNYCITSNHVHLVVHVDDTERVGLMMHLVAGAFARQRNSRKRHEGSVWEHPYQCTLVQSGEHLMNCIRYVSLNMVRAGVVCRADGLTMVWPAASAPRLDNGDGSSSWAGRSSELHAHDIVFGNATYL